jgi:hypothetical protein
MRQPWAAGLSSAVTSDGGGGEQNPLTHAMHVKESFFSSLFMKFNHDSSVTSPAAGRQKPSSLFLFRPCLLLLSNPPQTVS